MSFEITSETAINHQTDDFPDISSEILNKTLECGRRLENESYRFWLDGISVAIIGSFGFLGNLLSLMVLAKPQLNDVFHTLLYALAWYDLLFIIFGGIKYTFRAFNVSTDTYTYLFSYVVHPASHIAMAGTIFMTIAISIERYIGLCHPLSPVYKRKAWMYILPVLFCSVVLNVPKFFEIKIRMEYDFESGLEVPVVTHTKLRLDRSYILGYIMWTRLIFTGIVPVTSLIYFNLRIVFDLMKSRQVQRFGLPRQHNQERNMSLVLLCIVLTFFCCHASRIYLDIHEFSNLNKIMECKQLPWWPSDGMQILVHMSHFLMILNSSINFIFYCLLGQTFRHGTLRTFGFTQY